PPRLSSRIKRGVLQTPLQPNGSLLASCQPGRGPNIKTVNLKSDMPQVQEAVQRLAPELTLARQQKHAYLKIIHGYGSSGAGSDIRIAVQKRLHELTKGGQLGACI